jgi:uncharacterized protein YndB with AHSA1/START domain
MVVVSRSIHIAAPVERVFALMADPAARAALNPFAVPIRVEVENGAPLHLGSVCHYRLQMGSRIVDYRSRIAEFEPNRLIVSESDAEVPFSIRVEIVPDGRGGAWMRQVERFEPTDEMLRGAIPPTTLNTALRLAYGLALYLDLDAARWLRGRLEDALAQKLGDNLERWLEAIRAHLEKKN